MGIYTLATGLLGILANGLAILVFLKSPRVCKENNNDENQKLVYLASITLQLAADKSVNNGAHHFNIWSSIPGIQLICREMEFWDNILPNQCILYDILRFKTMKIHVLVSLVILTFIGIQSIVTLTVLAFQRFMMVTRFVINKQNKKIYCKL